MKRVLTIITFIWLCTYIAATNVPRTISGTVIDEKGESMIGVHVAVKGTNIGTITNIDGKFTIHSQEKSPVLIFSYVGYKKAEVRADKNILNVQMEPMENVLEDVVIVGYGSQKKRKCYRFCCPGKCPGNYAGTDRCGKQYDNR